MWGYQLLPSKKWSRYHFSSTASLLHFGRQKLIPPSYFDSKNYFLGMPQKKNWRKAEKCHKKLKCLVGFFFFQKGTRSAPSSQRKNILKIVHLWSKVWLRCLNRNSRRSTQTKHRIPWGRQGSGWLKQQTKTTRHFSLASKGITAPLRSTEVLWSNSSTIWRMRYWAYFESASLIFQN